jgi:hypothetical protein
MNVYSIVPSQRSHETVSVRISKMIPRYAQITPPIRSCVASSFCSAGEAPTPFEMKTIVSVFAHVQRKNATSHQT